MGPIFQTTPLVVGWLGSEDETSQMGMQSMRKVAHVALTLNVRNSRHPYYESTTEGQVTELCESVFRTFQEQGSVGCIGSVKLLLQTPYCTRLWIFQEKGLARYAVLICGPDCVHWEDAQALQEVSDPQPVTQYPTGLKSEDLATFDGVPWNDSSVLASLLNLTASATHSDRWPNPCPILA